MSNKQTTTKRGFNVSVTSVPITGDSEAAKIRNSNFHIVLNTNTRLDCKVTDLTPYVSGLQEAANALFGDPDNLEKVVTFPYGGSFDPETILNIDLMTRVEIGKDDAHGMRLHLHAYLKIRHKTKLRLDYGKVKAKMNDILEERGYPLKVHYVHVVLLTDRGQNLESYLHKV